MGTLHLIRLLNQISQQKIGNLKRTLPTKFFFQFD